MPKIAIIVQHLRNGGAEHSAAKLATALLGFGCHVDVFVFSNRNQQFMTKANIIDLHLDASKTRVQKALVFLKRFIKVAKHRMNGHYDYVISFLLSADMLNILTSLFGGRSVITVRNYTNLSSPSRIGFIINRFVYYCANRIITQTSLQMQSLHHDYLVSFDKMSCIPNSFDVNTIAVLGQELLSKEDEMWFNLRPTLVIVGRISMQKGQWNVIALIASLRAMGHEFNLAIIGAEDEPNVVDYCKKLVHNFGLVDHVRFLGVKSPPYPYIKRAWALILASLYEGFPNVLLEAMCLKTLVLATHCPSGPAEIFKENKITDVKGVLEGVIGVLLSLPKAELCVDVAWVNASAEIISALCCNNLAVNQIKNNSYKRALDYDYKNVNSLWLREIVS